MDQDDRLLFVVLFEYREALCLVHVETILGAANNGGPFLLWAQHQVDRVHWPRVAGKTRKKDGEAAWVGAQNTQLYALECFYNFTIYLYTTYYYRKVRQTLYSCVNTQTQWSRYQHSPTSFSLFLANIATCLADFFKCLDANKNSDRVSMVQPFLTVVSYCGLQEVASVEPETVDELLSTFKTVEIRCSLTS